MKGELDDQTILERLPGAFDAPLGLRRVGRDVADPEFLEDLSELRGGSASEEFLFTRPVSVVAPQSPSSSG